MYKLLLLFLILSLNISAQVDSSMEYSKLQNLMMRPGSFIRVDTDTIGATNSLYIGAITAEDLGTGEKQRSVCFIANIGFNNIYFSYTNQQIDIQDLDDFIASLTKMKEVIELKSTKELLAYQYTASNLLVLAMDNRIGRTNRWDITLGTRYKYLNSLIPGSLLFVKDKEVAQLVNLLIYYRQSLNGNLYK